ncbi:MAG TPA: 2-amino-4-hydroxy-6-hydroxymethyldihydropteridine diphosphokinase, partial [Deinococcales bacterium]|nr:2-amino-4-hydroxy-6-hydroxymethyldihydropteridine diphosphokinase [Deinococcales bacterium]
RAALAGLTRLPGTRLLAVSRAFETDPVGGPAGQGPYLNAAARLETRLSAPALLGALLGLEAARGRERNERWGARTLDLDLIAYGRLTLDAPGLSLPHPRAAQRAFVLAPLADVAPGWELDGRTVVDFLAALPESGVRVSRVRLG